MILFYYFPFFSNFVAWLFINQGIRDKFIRCFFVSFARADIQIRVLILGHRVWKPAPASVVIPLTTDSYKS